MSSSKMFDTIQYLRHFSPQTFFSSCLPDKGLWDKMYILFNLNFIIEFIKYLFITSL